MTRSASLPEPQARAARFLGRGASAFGAAVARNPGYVGGGTAFLVVLAFVSSNALWYQPHAHPEPLLQTRFVVERPPEPAPPPKPRAAVSVPAATDAAVTASVPKPALPADPTVERVQRVLATLALYDGAVDGISGPRTRRAVEEYRRLVGLGAGGIDEALLAALSKPDAGGGPPGTAPVPRPRAEAVPSPVSRTGGGAPSRVAEIQASLRAFGNDDVEIDGIVGETTRRAIREFQSLFGLPVTGEPDEALLAKMAEIGLSR